MESGDRLKVAREARGYKTAAEFARRYHIGESIHTHRENKTRGLSRKAAIWYASVLKISLEWLLTGHGSMDDKKRQVPLGGYIGAGAEVYPVNDDAVDHVDAPDGAGPDTIALLVKGDSMYPAYSDGDLVYYEAREAAEDCIGMECVVELEDGRRLLKIITAGLRKGFYTLISHNAPPMAGIRLAWAHPITWVKKARTRNPHAAQANTAADLPIKKFKKTAS